MTTNDILIVNFKFHVNEDVTDRNLRSNIVEPSVTITIGEDNPSGEKKFTTEIKLEKEENETDEWYFYFMKVQLRKIISFIFAYYSWSLILFFCYFQLREIWPSVFTYCSWSLLFYFFAIFTY